MKLYYINSYIKKLRYISKFYRFLYLIIFILIFPISELFPQYAPFDSIPSHSIGAGLASTGVGFKDDMLNLNSNPSFLAGTTSTLIDGGGLLSYRGSKPGSGKPGGIGFYIPLNNISGWGVSGRIDFHSSFPEDKRFSFFTGHIFYSRVFSEKYFLSLGAGPGFGLREREQSNLGLSPFISGGVVFGKFIIGGKILYPGGLYKYKLYRGGDELEDKPPPVISFGTTFFITDNLSVYSEIKRVLYERSIFDLNGENCRPNFDRGIGAELKGSVGISFSLKEESIFKIRSGLEAGGKYDERGKNLRGTGIGFGLGYIPNPNSKGFEMNFSILDYSILSPKNGYPSETLFYLNLGYRYE